MLLQLPVALSAFARVQVQLPGQLPAVSADDELEEPATSPSICTDSRTTKLYAIAHEVQQKQPGGPLVAYPCTAGYCQVTCQKVRIDVLQLMELNHVQMFPICQLPSHGCTERPNAVQHGKVQNKHAAFSYCCCACRPWLSMSTKVCWPSRASFISSFPV